MSEETIKLSIQTPTVDDGGLKTIRAYVQSLDRFHKLAQKPITIRVETQGVDRARQALEQARQTGMKAMALPASVPKSSPYLASLQTHLTAVARYTNEFHVSMAKLKAGFRSPEQKIGFLTSVEEQISRAGKAAQNFHFRQPADREGFFDSLKSASNMIKLESEAMHAAQLDAMKSKEDAKVFQAPDERKGAARGKTDALAAADKNLATATGQAKQGIVEQDRALLAKIRTLHSSTVATDALSRSEKKLASSAASSAAAERGALIKRVERDGTLKSRTYAVAPGVTQVVSPGATGDSTTVTTDKMAELRNRVKETNEEFSRLLTKRKAEGAGVREVSAIYAQQANALDKLSSEYRAIDDATGRMVARQAEAARVKSGATRSTAIRKAEAADLKKSALAGLEFQKRMESAKWTEIQKIEDRARAVIAGKSAAGAAPRDIARDYEQMAKEIEAVSRKFRSPQDSMEAARRAASFRSKGHQIQLRSEAAAWQQTKAERARAYKEAIQQAAAHQLTMDTMTDMKARGFKESNRGRYRMVSGASRETIDFAKENGSLRENVRLMVERDAKGRIINATSAETSKALVKTAESTGYLTKNFIQNTATVAVWAASVGALYGGLAIVRSGMEAAVNYDRKFAALTVVFRGTENQAAQLRDEVLLLAAAYGQSGGQALDAAIRFSRLGMSQAQTLEAVRASLMAANVAEMGVGEAADALAAIMATFNLEAKDLMGVINRLNAISNTYNVTNKDMIGGLARVGSVARTSGLSLEETMGTIAAVSRRTGRSGAEAGNALKAIIVSLANPTKQKNLADMFDFSVTDQTGELKSMSDVLRDLFLRYQDLTSAEQQHLLQVVAGKQQASRLAAMIDGYVDSQLMAIRSVTNLDSAEKENARIKQSLLVQLQGLATAYERLVSNMANSGGNLALIGTLRELTMFLKNSLNLMATHSDATAVMIGMTALFGARMGVTALRVAEAGNQINFATNTSKALRSALGSLHTTLATMNRELIYSGSRGMMGFTRGMMGATGATRALGIALAWTAGALRALVAATVVGVALYGIMAGVNAIASQTGSEWEKAQQKLAGFNKELEDLKKLSEGGRMSERTSETIIARLRTGKVGRAEAERYIEAGAEMASNGDDSRRRSVQQELSQAYLKGGSAGLAVRYEQALHEIKKARLKVDAQLAARETVALGAAREALRIANAKLAANRDNAEAERNALEARKNYMDLADKSLKRAAYGDDPEAANEAERQEELRQQKTRSRMEKIMESHQKGAAAAYEGFTSIGPIDKVALQIASIDAQVGAIKSYRSELEKSGKAELAAAESSAASAKLRYDAFTAYQKTVERIQGLEAGLMLLKDKGAGIQKYDANLGGLQANSAQEPPLTKEYVANQALITQIKSKLEYLNKSREQMEAGNPDIIASSNAAGKAQTESDQLVATKRNELQIQQDIANKKLEDLEITRQQLEIEMKKEAVMTQAIEDGRRRGAMATLPLQYGNETQRIMRERRVLLDKTPIRDKDNGMAMNMASAKQDYDKAVTTGDEAGQAKALEQLRAMIVVTHNHENLLLERNNKLAAERFEIERKTNQERSRSLIMGDRESQLRAAMAAKLGKKKGGFKAEDFMFMSQETKQSIAQTNPELLPPEMRTDSQQNKEEQSQAKQALKEITDSLAAVVKVEEEYARLRLQGAKDSASSAIDPAAMVAGIQKSGADAVTAINQLGQATIDQLNRIANAGSTNAFQIRRMTLGDPAANAQSVANGP